MFTCLRKIVVESVARLPLAEQRKALACLCIIFVELAAGLSLTEQR